MFYLTMLFSGVDGLDKAESQRHLSKGNQLLNAGQLAEALTHYHSAIGCFFDLLVLFFCSNL